METDRPLDVVVGIDGSPSGAHALDWAADEAQRRGAGLLIAHAGHVAHQVRLRDETATAAQRDVCDFGRELLADAIATVADSNPRLPARTELHEEEPAGMLVRLGRQAALLVVGRGNGGPIARFVLGSTSQRVAEGAGCPVVVVDSPAAASDTVVVGVSATDGGRSAIRFAAAEAQLRGSRLLAVRSQIELGLAATSLRSAPTSSVDALLSAERALLADAVDAVRAEHPTLLVESTLTDAPPHEALRDAAADAALLVVGCRRPPDSRLPHLGPHASWLLQHSPCPVAIVGQQSA